MSETNDASLPVEPVPHENDFSLLCSECENDHELMTIDFMLTMAFHNHEAGE